MSRPRLVATRSTGGRRGSLRRVRPALVAAVAILSTLSGWPVASADAHYIFTCPGYQYLGGGRYQVPEDCSGGDPGFAFRSPGTHQWLTHQAARILRQDGHTRFANLLRSRIRTGANGAGQRHMDLLIEGMVRADTGLNGCTDYGQEVGWPIGDHGLNPYRSFGFFSYNRSQDREGWHGHLYPRSGPCASAPDARSTAARMADEFFRRAQESFRAGQPGNAMFNLGIALHTVQDAAVPEHSHPERPHFYFEAWANANKERFAVGEGGSYLPPRSLRGVRINNTPGGWAYWMAAESYPYYRFDSATSARPRRTYRCPVAQDPERCRASAGRLLKVTQRASAGFLRYFFRSVAR